MTTPSPIKLPKGVQVPAGVLDKMANAIQTRGADFTQGPPPALTPAPAPAVVDQVEPSHVEPAQVDLPQVTVTQVEPTQVGVSQAGVTHAEPPQVEVKRRARPAAEPAPAPAPRVAPGRRSDRRLQLYLGDDAVYEAVLQLAAEEDRSNSYIGEKLIAEAIAARAAKAKK